MQIDDKKVREAAYDFRFLLNRNYRRKNALEFVSNKYLLSKRERNFLARAIFSEFESKERYDKLVDIDRIEGEYLVIDGYNVLITVESILSEDFDHVVLCDDNVVRDLNAVFGKYKFSKVTEMALTQIFILISKYKPFNIVFFLDSPVSFSGKLAELIKDIITDIGLKGVIKLSNNVDMEIKELIDENDGIVATSDSAIIDKADKFVDIPSYFLKTRNGVFLF